MVELSERLTGADFLHTACINLVLAFILPTRYQKIREINKIKIV
jgi:hypothetical protein